MNYIVMSLLCDQFSKLNEEFGKCRLSAVEASFTATLNSFVNVIRTSAAQSRKLIVLS